MMTAGDPKKRGLGRGLGALMPTASEPAPSRVPDPSRKYFHAQIEDVYPSPDQPRRRFDDGELDELAQSIRAHGVIMPLVVRTRPGGGYLLIAGERRWRASQRAGLREVPVVVQDVDGREAFERALVENLQRSDLNPIEEAAAFQRLLDEFGLTQEAVAERVGKERSTVANAVRLLKLPAAVRQMVEERRLSMGHARALLGLDSGDAIEVAARQVAARGLSVRATEDLVRKGIEGPKAPAAAPAEKSPSVKDLEERLTRALGGPVSITEDPPRANRAGGSDATKASQGGVQSGTIELRYLDLDHLDRLLEKLL